MLVNNPMGSRRRRRFYHRAGVVPIPGDFTKEDFADPNFLNYELEPFEYTDEEEFQPTASFTEGGKRRVNFITVSSLHARLVEIIDSMIELAEAEDREKENEEGDEKDGDQDADDKIAPDPAQDNAQDNVEDQAQEAGPSGAQTNAKAEKE